jgi:hypothetical protein
MALKRCEPMLDRHGNNLLSAIKLCRVGGSLWYALKLWAWARVELPQVQILVVVANIQMRTLKAEVEKGSM